MSKNLYSFEKALEFLKKGKKLCRDSWVDGSFLAHTAPQVLSGEGVNVNPNINSTFLKNYGLEKLKTTDRLDAWEAADNRFVAGWLPSSDDLFAEDWYVVDDITNSETLNDNMSNTEDKQDDKGQVGEQVKDEATAEGAGTSTEASVGSNAEGEKASGDESAS